MIWLVFNEGYSATASDDWTRPDLCADARRLGRILAALMPREPEVHGLLALMELQASRLRAHGVRRRGGPAGRPGSRAGMACSCSAAWRGSPWAESLGAPLGPYTLRAAIAACHARASSVEATDLLLAAAVACGQPG